MPTLFITGDRSIHPGAAAGLTNLVLLKEFVADSSVQFATGTENGVEAAVRFGAEAAGLTVLTFETPSVEGHPEWKDFAKRVQNVLDADPSARFVVIHGSPENSRITKALCEMVPEDQLQIVAPSLA